jgi:hypothetical protein
MSYQRPDYPQQYRFPKPRRTEFYVAGAFLDLLGVALAIVLPGLVHEIVDVFGKLADVAMGPVK